MEVTIDLTPELESRLQAEAARKGLEAPAYILDTLREHLQQGAPVPHLPQDEAALLQAINQGPSQQTWQRYRELIERREAQTLSTVEQAELIALSDRIEEANTRRMESLVRLAGLRGVSLEALMDELGIHARSHA